MKLGFFNSTNSYLFHDLEEGCKENNIEFAKAALMFDPMKPPMIDEAHNEIARVKEELSSCDYVVVINWDPIFERCKMFDPERTVSFFFDPPSHFPAPQTIAGSFQMTKVGPHQRIEWGAMNRFFTQPAHDIHWGGAAFMRLYLDQAESIARAGNMMIAKSFYEAAMERFEGVTQCFKKLEFAPFAVYGGKDWQKLGVNAQINTHEQLHEVMAKCSNIIDHCRPDVGENPKYLYACAMNKPYWLIERNLKTNKLDVVKKPWRKPRTMKEVIEELADLITKACARRKTQFVGLEAVNNG